LATPTKLPMGGKRTWNIQQNCKWRKGLGNPNQVAKLGKKV